MVKSQVIRISTIIPFANSNVYLNAVLDLSLAGDHVQYFFLTLGKSQKERDK